MTFFTRPRLDNLQFQQQSGDTLTLSGTTIFAKTIGGLGINDQSGNTITFNATITGDPIEDNGKALVYSGGSIIFGEGGGGAALLTNLSGGTGLIFKDINGGFSNLRSLSGGTGINIVTSGDVITFKSDGGTLGVPTDTTYTDGLFPFTASTLVGDAVDDINEFLGLLAPAQPPILRDQNTIGSFVDGKLSFGASNPIATYSDVVAGFDGSLLNTNDNFPTSGDRKGLTQNSLLVSNQITGVLNDDVTDGDPSGIPYRNDAFRDGNSGVLTLEFNGSVIDTLDLTSTDNAVDGISGYLDVSQVYPVKFDNGNDFGALLYRIGTFTVPSTEFRNGYNYLRVIHTIGSTVRTTNYTNWVYDSNIDAIGFTRDNASDFTTINLTGVNDNTSDKYVSGVRYYTGGNVIYEGVATNVYKNVYSNETNAITFTNRVHLSETPSAISVLGSGIVNGTSRALPNLNTGVSDPQNTNITISATLSIDSTKVLGNKLETNLPTGIVDSGEIQSSININHPFSDKEYVDNTASEISEAGFLIYNILQPTDNSIETFEGEIERLIARDYTSLTFGEIEGSASPYLFRSNGTTNTLTGSSTFYNTGLLVFNGGLYYPNSSQLFTDYGISNCNFNSLLYSPANNRNYTNVSGQRDYYRRFTSDNPADLGAIEFVITHNGTSVDFLTNGGTAGVPSGDQIKFEFLIKRQNGNAFVAPWANPFSTDAGSQGGIQNTTTSGNNTTTVACNLGTQIVVSQGDIVIVRMKVSNNYSNKITEINITSLL